MWRDNHYVAMMSGKAKNSLTPCIPTRGTQVPSCPEWFHEVKQDGFRLIVQREVIAPACSPATAMTGPSYPLIVEAARRINTTRFVIDGEAVLLGVDGISDCDDLYNGRQNHEVQLNTFDILALDGDSASPQAPISLAFWPAVRMASIPPPSSKARLGRTCSRQPAT
jgi:ATP-dependent DNA ligase